MKYLILLLILFSSLVGYSQNIKTQFDVKFEYRRVNDNEMVKCDVHIKINNTTISIIGNDCHSIYSILEGSITDRFRCYVCKDDTEIIWDSESHKCIIFYPIKDNHSDNDIKIIQYYSIQ